MNIREIASIAKVSVSTVSKIINGKDKSISDSTRERVLNVIKEYQYSPYSNINIASRTNLIALLVSNCSDDISELVKKIQNAAFLKGYSIILSNTDTDEEKQIKVLESKKVMGAVIISSTDNCRKSLDYFKKNNLPVVLINNYDANGDVSVYCSKKKAGYIAAEFLLKKGHRHIGYLAYESFDESYKDIEEGYLKALYENDISKNANAIFVGKDVIEAGQIGAQRLINTNITAILCENSDIACCAYQVLHENGIDIPKDVSLVSASDSKVAKLLKPQLTTVEEPYDKISENAVEELVNMIESNEKPNGNQQIEIKPVLNERKSVSVPPLVKRGQQRKIIAVGSMNMDITVNVPNIPSGGETIFASGTAVIPGGKGANQAVGVAKLDGLIYAIGRIGNDSDGKGIYGNLVNNAVKTDGIIFDDESSTGKAYINVAHDGESTIVVYPGANNKIDREQIDKFRHIFTNAKFCLLSMEIPLDTVEYTIEVCRQKNVKVILKPAYNLNMESKLLSKIEYIVPNRRQLDFLVPECETIEKKAEYFYKMGVKNVIVTLGKEGCYLKNKQYSMFFPAADFIPIDTTGASDAFISALAVHLCDGADIIHSIRYATYAAGLSTTRAGVQPALPDRMALNIYKDDINA